MYLLHQNGSLHSFIVVHARSVNRIGLEALSMLKAEVEIRGYYNEISFENFKRWPEGFFQMYCSMNTGVMQPVSR